MIKLIDIIKEETFTAINKDTGKVSVFKSKDSRDAAVKAGTHKKRDEKDSEDKNKSDNSVSGKNMFKHASDIKKQAGDTKEEEPTSDSSSEPIEFDIDDIGYFTDIDDLIDQYKSKLSPQQIDKLKQLSADWEYAEDEMQMGGDDDEYEEQMSDILSAVEDIFSNLEEPTSESITGRSIKENRWLELKNSEQTPNQKIGKGIREINYQLKEIEKFVGWYSRIKNENDLNSDKYWKRTTNHLNKIRERLMRLSNKMNNL